MFATPGSLLALDLLGIFALAVLISALLLLARAARPGVVRHAEPSPSGDGHRVHVYRVTMQRRRRGTLLALGTVMLLAVFFGRSLVLLAFPAGATPAAGRPGAALATTRVLSGPDATQPRLALSESGPAAGPVLVFTHGWGADRDDWADLVANLPATYRIVTWDLPGLGDSTKLGDDQYQVATLADQLDRVVASQGGRPVMLVGHSIGGMINLEYARRHPERLGHDVVGMVQVDTTFTDPVETKKHADRSKKLQKPVYEPLLHVVAATSPVCRALGWLAYRSGLAHLQLATQSFAGAETREQLDRMARYAYQSSPSVVAEGTLGMLHWDATPVLATLRVPTLILSGAQDTTTLPSASQRMNAEIPQSTLVSISPAAHLGPVEQAARYAGAIDAFAQARTATVAARAS